MKSFRFAFFLLLVLVVPASAQTRHAAAIAQARQFIRDSMALAHIPGVSITVSINDTVVWSEGFGFADLEQRVPVTPRTKFRVGSVSKPLTATALGLLWQEGKLQLDSVVQVYVSSFPQKRWPVTVREVAGHIAGIRHYRGDEMLLAYRYRTVSEGLAIFKDDTLLFQPRSRYSYSSYGWNLLSAVIEGASKEPFLHYMQRHVFGPLGMHNTVPDYSDSLIVGRARWYTEDSLGATINAPFVDNSYKWAGGGFLSTTEDLARFGDAMLDHRLLSKRTTDLWWTSQALSDGKLTNYGIGWAVRQDRQGRRVISHTGGSVGGTAHLYLLPEQHVVIALLVNSDLRFIHHVPALAEYFLQR